jgi:hypothetical protein
MNGSRTNPNVPKDIFQDYDIVYVVTDTASFIEDENRIKIFPDDCVLVCVGPICTLACYGTGVPTLDCDIVCDDEGNCFLICPYDTGR